jgi:alpha-L-fucosidase
MTPLPRIRSEKEAPNQSRICRIPKNTTPNPPTITTMSPLPRLLSLALCAAAFLSCATATPAIDMTAKPDAVRGKEIADMKWGMFICWSFSTFSGVEWTPTKDKDASYFKATGCDTDQWCQTAKEAGMGYILFLTKHHDGFCLWDTKTTEKKVTNSPLKRDVLAELRKSCDKYGIKLAIYFSEGDWNWPEAVDGKGQKGGHNPEMKKAQLKELLTQYGPIEYIWFDHAVGEGGLSHAETDKWVAQFQPNCLPGYNHGALAGRIRLGEMGRPSALNDASGAGYNKRAAEYKGYIAAEFTYPILPKHQGGAMWFYSLPRHDNLCIPAETLYQDYLGAVKYSNIFSIDVGPDYAGKLRAIDVKTLQTVGKYISGELKPAIPQS